MRQLRSIAATLFLVLATAVHAAAPVDVVEFYHQGFDHYFVSSLAADIAALDSGTLKGWARTGRTFKAYDAPAAGMSPVCRFYIPPAQGDSHFYSASPAECAEVATKFPTFTYESPSVMYVGLPDAPTGACAAGTLPVYRLWNNRVDSNHRYTTDTGVRAEMLARGYIAEGYGPEGVAMCSPSTTNSFEIALSPAVVTLTPGETRDVQVTVTPNGGFAGPVALVVAGLPVGTRADPATATVNVGPGPGSIVVHVAAEAAAAPTGSVASATVSATAGGASAVATLRIGIVAAGSPVAARLRVIADVEQRARELSAPAPSSPAFLQAINAYMASRSEYTATGIDGETQSAWGRFADGRLHLVVANRDPAPAGSFVKTIEPRSNVEVPDATTARLLHSFGTNFEGQTPIDEMRGALRSRGWSVRSGPEGMAGIEMLKAASGDGYFYINTHGGRGETGDPGEPEGKIYAIQTSTLVSDDLEQAYDADLKALNLIHFTARNGEQITLAGFPVMSDWDTRYAITYRFVVKYMNFAPGSVAFINACYSSRNAPFVNAFLFKGVGVYLGWSEKVSAAAAYESPPYFVDRMVGANQHKTKESPPQRPFAYDLVLQDMTKKGLDTDKATGAKLQATAKTGAPPPIFAPSIRYVAVEEYGDTLTLTGEFGSRAGKVTVGGTELAIRSWAPTRIDATLPLTGAGSSGDVVVEVDRVRSNARQLTEWVIPIKYSWVDVGDTPGWRVDGAGAVRLRADIAGYRLLPAEAPKYKSRGGALTRDSAMRITASGSSAMGDCTATLGGTGEYVAPVAGAATILASAFRVAADTRQGALGLALGFAQSPHTITISGRDCPSVTMPFAATFGLLDGPVSFPNDQTDNPQIFEMPGVTFTLDSAFNIPPVSNSSNDAGGTLTVSWSGVVTKAPPRDTDDAGK
ncbi:MAG: hypothetical protein IT522_11090 [Burkholderiales bacterium]|nr:hypothetical protein [Burkholderiales bacterium]